MESLVRRYDAVRPHLTERQRRVWLGAEARELGSGGVRIVADAVGVSPDTVRRGLLVAVAALAVALRQGRRDHITAQETPTPTPAAPQTATSGGVIFTGNVTGGSGSGLTTGVHVGRVDVPAGPSGADITQRWRPSFSLVSTPLGGDCGAVHSVRARGAERGHLGRSPAGSAVARVMSEAGPGRSCGRGPHWHGWPRQR